MSGGWLYVLQRATALVLAPLVLVHLGLIVYAVRGGLSGAEILGRTQGSPGWAAFYGLFVVAAAIHGSIGLRTILAEWTPLGGRRLDALVAVVGVVLLVLGFRAVIAVTAGGE